jgi:hypothetical protein
VRIAILGGCIGGLATALERRGVEAIVCDHLPSRFAQIKRDLKFALPERLSHDTSFQVRVKSTSKTSGASYSKGVLPRRSRMAAVKHSRAAGS